MNKKHFFLVVIFLIPFFKGVAQTVSVPDPGFKSCLLERYPGTLDASQNLILEKAAQLSGTINCSNRNIKNAEGIQYFTAVSEINLSNNALAYLPEISGLSMLKGLKVSDNQLIVLPELSNLAALTHLDVRRNGLKTLPDLSNNIDLVYINAHTNQIDTLPSLDALVNLTYLNVAINKLSRLPKLNNLQALQELRCWNNNIKELPPLNESDNLVILDASTNQIESIPPFSPATKIEVINLEWNLLQELPDFSIYKNLKRARLNNNNLTFVDLFPLSDVPGFDTIFPLSSQKPVIVGRDITGLEAEKLILETGIDRSINGTLYEWMYNGKPLRTSVKDTISVLTSTANTGYYYCKISHPLFPGLVLQTDSFFVNIMHCINLDGFSTSVTGTTCLKAGSLSVHPFNQPVTNLSYTLKSNNSGKVFTSQNGQFQDLHEPEYQLIVKAGENCIKELPELIYIPVKNCTDTFITPNGDGVDDGYFFTQSGKAIISDKWGNIVKTIAIPGEWNGVGVKGLVPPGLYIININDGEEVIKMSVIH